MTSQSRSILLKIGGLGFLLGFASWIAWVVMVILSFEGILLFNGDFRWLSGVFFQAPSSRLIFYGLLSVSLLFSAVGSFALPRKQASWLGVISGVALISAFVVSVMYLLPFFGLEPRIYPNPYPVMLIYATYLFPFLFFSGLVIWGTTLLLIARRTSAGDFGHATGAFFLVSGGFGILLWPVILYWGLELWLLLLGWLYAAGALMAIRVLARNFPNSQNRTV
jgi:hypothetical protein